MEMEKFKEAHEILIKSNYIQEAKESIEKSIERLFENNRKIIEYKIFTQEEKKEYLKKLTLLKSLLLKDVQLIFNDDLIKKYDEEFKKI